MSITPEEAQQLHEAESARLRSIGLKSLFGIVAVLVVITIVLISTSGGDSRQAVLVIGGNAKIGDLDKGDVVRVTGQVRNSLAGSRFGDHSDSNTIEATKIVRTTAGSGGGTTSIKAVSDDDGLRGKTVTIVGEVLSDTSGDLLSLAKPN